MREKVKDRGRLEHILEAINEIQEYKSQYTLEDVKNSKLVFYGFTKFVEVIGEAVYMLTKEFRASHPEVDWRVIEKMRHLRYLRDFIQRPNRSLKSVFICSICGTMLKTRNSLAISDISLIFAACKQ